MVGLEGEEVAAVGLVDRLAPYRGITHRYAPTASTRSQQAPALSVASILQIVGAGVLAVAAHSHAALLVQQIYFELHTVLQIADSGETIHLCLRLLSAPRSRAEHDDFNMVKSVCVAKVEVAARFPAPRERQILRCGHVLCATIIRQAQLGESKQSCTMFGVRYTAFSMSI